MEAIILLAHGAPGTLEEVEEYVLRIRHGRPLSPDLMDTIRDRYRRIGGSPLLPWTIRQAEALQSLLQTRSDPRKVYFGMRHSSPFIKQTVDQMLEDGVHGATVICLAPQFSQLTIGAYQKAIEEAIAGRNLQIHFVPSYAKNPQLIAAFAANLRMILAGHADAFVIFTAHSLPARVLAEGDPYDYQVKETALSVARTCKLTNWLFAYQSQGMTSEKWLGPTVETRLNELAARSIAKVIVQPVGFVSDHAEILYDVDIHFHQEAAQKGIQLFRVPSLNDSPLFIELLYELSLQ